MTYALLLSALTLIPQPRELTVSGGETDMSVKITCVEIADAPAFRWHGRVDVICIQ